MFCLALGLQTCASTLIGTEIGRGNIREARDYQKLIYRVLALLIAFIVCLFVTFRKSCYRLFTDDDEILEIALQVSPLVAMTFIPDFFQAVMGGVIRALGLQEKVVRVTLFAYWVINLGLIFVLGFYFDLKIIGVQISLLTTLVFLSFKYWQAIESQNWEKLSEQANERQLKECEFLDKSSDEELGSTNESF